MEARAVCLPYIYIRSFKLRRGELSGKGTTEAQSISLVFWSRYGVSGRPPLVANI